MMSNINNSNYHDLQNKENIMKMRKVLADLPPFCKEFFRGIETTTSTRTRLAYAYDLRVFFEFLVNHNDQCTSYTSTTLPLEVLDTLKRVDIEEYIDYLNFYENNEKEITNGEQGRKRKLATIRTFYKYFYKDESLKNNPAALVSMPKIHEKEIIRLEPNEVASLLDQVEEGEKLTKKELAYYNKTRLRDLAILTLLLGTGIRVSECVGLNINDIDFEKNGMKIRRKGGYETVLYFSTEVESALENYLEQRIRIIPVTGHEEALFLSLQLKRLSVRSVENLVKKYSQKLTTLKKITPHKLRSTYGTNLYQETGDIYLVADVLGHKDVNTTRKHYAAIEDERRRMAATKVTLRESKD